MIRPMFQSVLGAIRTSAAVRWHDVLEARSQTRAALGQQRMLRRARTRAFRRALLAHRAAIIRSLRTAVAAPSGATPALRPQPAIPHSSAWDLSFEPATDTEPFAARTTPSLAPVLPAEPLHSQVLRVIEGHPEGVRARDVGNELGVDWRRVVGITQSLVDAGKVEQVEQELYPAGKAGPRW